MPWIINLWLRLLTSPCFFFPSFLLCNYEVNGLLSLRRRIAMQCVRQVSLLLVLMRRKTLRNKGFQYIWGNLLQTRHEWVLDTHGAQSQNNSGNILWMIFINQQRGNREDEYDEKLDPKLSLCCCNKLSSQQAWARGGKWHEEKMKSSLLIV